MSDINLTPNRAEVLKAVSRGEVKHQRYWGKDPDEDRWKPEGDHTKTVTGICTYLRRAGLIRIGRALGPSMYSSQMWELTEAGEQWIEEHP